MGDHQFLAAFVGTRVIKMLLLLIKNKQTITTNINWAFSMFQALCQTPCVSYIIQPSDDPASSLLFYSHLTVEGMKV